MPKIAPFALSIALMTPMVRPRIPLRRPFDRDPNAVKPLSLSLLAVALSVSAAALRADCHFFAAAGSSITPRNGDCKDASGDPKDGVERCFHRDQPERQISELKYAKGKRTGPGWYTDYNERRLEFTFQDDVAVGAGRYLFKEGKPECEASFTGGKATGPVRTYFPNGKLKEVALYRNGENDRGKLSFTENGTVDSLVCPVQSMAPEDRSLCGFDGKTATVDLDRGPNRTGMYQLTHENGKLIRKKTTDRQGREMRVTYPQPGNEDEYAAQVLFANGNTFRAFSIKRSQYDGAFKEFSESGQLVEETVFAQGKPQKQTLYFLNGKIKHAAEAVTTPPGATRVIRYYDNGKPNMEATYTDARYAEAKDGGWTGFTTEDVAKSFREDGSLMWEEQYSKGRLEGASKQFRRDGSTATLAEYRKGQLVKLTCLDSKGAPRFTEERFEDGSRKSASPDISVEEATKQKLCTADE